jgi:RNA polymerase sigma-70 factor (ECF subfamily)
MPDACLPQLSLAKIFAEKLSKAALQPDWPQLEELLGAVLQQAREAWPMLLLRDRQFIEYLAARMPPDGNPLQWLRTVQSADLYLCCECAAGNPNALAIFEAKLLPQVVQAIASINSEASFVAEVQQQVRRKLLVAEESPPRIAEYAGLGPLLHWLRAVAVRTALNLRRSQGRQDIPVADESLLNLPHSAGDLELDYLKTRYRKDFTHAFGESLSLLSSEERNVLRLHFVEGLTLTQIGAVYQADKSTISRWISKARKSLLEHTREGLSKKFRLDSRELDSLMYLVQSQLDVSISTLLRRSRA